jgi:hypothetical protein
MNTFNKLRQNILVIGLMSMMSVLFVASAPFEINPQSCAMIRVIGKKKE